MIYFIVIVIQMIQFLNFDKEPLKGIVYKRRKFSWWNIDNSNLLCLLTSFLSQIPCFASEDLSTSHFSYVLLWALTDSYKIAWQHFNIKYLFVRCVITNDSRIGQLGEKILILSLVTSSRVCVGLWIHCIVSNKKDLSVIYVFTNVFT